MKTRLLAVSLLVARSVAAFACTNFSDIDLNGKPSFTTVATSRKTLLGAESPEFWQRWASVLEQRMAENPSSQTQLSDYGGILAHLGQYEKARQVLEEAERLQPGQYSVAANLGTVYELLGDNEKAHQWIEKGMKLNPSAHGGTEWLHLRILQVKMELAKDQKWLETHTVLGPKVNYGNAPRPMPADQTSNERRIASLAIQLHERLQFVPAPEPIVGELLFDLANEVALGGAVADALSIYELAAEYQPVQMTLLKTRLAYARALVAKEGLRRQRLSEKLQFEGERAAANAKTIK